MTQLSLKNMLVPSKDTVVEFPGFPEFSVNVSFISRETLVNIRKKAITQKFKNRQLQEDLDEKLFLKLYTEAAIKGWKGLSLRILDQLAPVDLSGEDDIDQELEYTPENALFLMQSSAAFDGFITETVGDLGNFTKSSKSK